MSVDTSHDSGYKLLFAHPRVVEDLLRGFVGEDWVEDLDFATLERISGSYVSDDLREREDDLIWRVRCQDAWLYVYLLLEFQSTEDPWMALRMMVYTGLLYQDLIKSGEVRRGQKLPPVFPLVLYNGRQPWGAARDVGELIDTFAGSLRRYFPAQRYFLLAENAVGEECLADTQNTVAGIIRLETSAAPSDVRQALAQLTSRLQGPEHASLRRAFVVWINRIVLRRLMPGQQMPEVNELQEINAMLAETVEEWTRQWKQEGRQEGRQEGENALLRKLLERRFGALPAWVDECLAKAGPAQLETWGLELLEAKALEDVFREP